MSRFAVGFLQRNFQNEQMFDLSKIVESVSGIMSQHLKIPQTETTDTTTDEDDERLY